MPWPTTFSSYIEDMPPSVLEVSGFEGLDIAGCNTLPGDTTLQTSQPQGIFLNSSEL
jgi:hypothetical protein